MQVYYESIIWIIFSLSMQYPDVEVKNCQQVKQVVVSNAYGLLCAGMDGWMAVLISPHFRLAIVQPPHFSLLSSSLNNLHESDFCSLNVGNVSYR